jgi:hypothetical protein
MARVDALESHEKQNLILPREISNQSVEFTLSVNGSFPRSNSEVTETE